MADISVSLTLDTSQFNQGLLKIDAQITTTTDKVKGKAKEMGDAIDEVVKHVDSLASKMG
jgi:hypothetical protein